MDKIIERNWNNDPLSYPVVFGHKKKKNNVEPLNPHLEVSVHLFMDDARHFGKDWAVAHFFRMEEHFKELKRIMNLPSMIYRPKLVIDGGTRWMAIYDDLFGVGNSPAQAMDDFDKKFYRDINIGGVIK